jgi:hypothetical protein
MPCGGVYSYDPINRIIASYEITTNDMFNGVIGTLKPKAFEKFMKMVDAKTKDKY